MKYLFSCGIAALMSGLVLSGAAMAKEPGEKGNSSRPGEFKRIVLLKFKDDTAAEKVRELLDGIRGLGPKIPAIATLAVAANTNTSKLSQGFTHVVVLSFKTDKDRTEFLADPTHKQYETQVLVPHLEKALVVEFNSPPPK